MNNTPYFAGEEVETVHELKAILVLREHAAHSLA